MKTPNPIVNPMSRAQRRFERARPGSILIMVVALLVLLALMGTAYIATARIDRISAAKSATVMQVGQLAESMAQQLLQQTRMRIVNGLFNKPSTTQPAQPTGYRLAADLTNAATLYHPWDAETPDLPAACPWNAQDIQDPWLASLVPALDPVSNQIYWPAISRRGNLLSFETPQGTSIAMTSAMIPLKAELAVQAVSYTGATLDPTLAGRTRFFPALKLYDSNGTTVGTYWAADADGDGVPDSLLWRLGPVAPVNQLTWYGAIRVVDNCAKVNVNTAWSRDPEASANSNYGDNLCGVFPTSVGLLQMMGPTAAAQLVNNPITNNPTTPPYYGINVSRFGTSPTSATPPAASSPAIADNPYGTGDPALPTPRPDCSFFTQGEALYFQYGRRLDNPGFNTATVRYGASNSGNSLSRRAFGAEDSAALAYRFVMARPGVLSPLEYQTSRAVPNNPGVVDSFYRAAINFTNNLGDAWRFLPVDPNAWAYWYNYNFNYAGGPVDLSTYSYPIRHLVTANNPVSNVASVHPMTNNVPAAIVAITNPPPLESTTIGAAPARVPQNPTPTVLKHARPRVSVNTARFGELWWGFWNVMCDEVNPGIPPAYASGMMFRSPVRGARAVLTPSQVMFLRAAVAAVNTMDLRNSTSQDVTAENIQLPDPVLGTGPTATVYGTKPQCYITEVVADTGTEDPCKPGSVYIGVELLNPYPVDINVHHWKLAVLDRGTMTLTEIGDLGTLIGGTELFPAGAYYVVENGATGICPDSIVNARSGSPAPPASTKFLTPLPALSSAVGKELVILRPRKSGDPAGEASTTATPSAQLANMVPLDQVDLDQIVMLNPGDLRDPTAPNPARRWFYCRPNAMTDSTCAWGFVYPAEKIVPATGAGGYPTVTAWQHAECTPGDPTKTPPIPPGPPDRVGQLGYPDSYAIIQTPNKVMPITYRTGGATYQIQLADQGWAGPNASKYPYGAFARTGDLMLAPYIGAYCIQDSTGMIEMNAVTSDSYFSESDSPPAPDSVPPPQLGRFCPWGDPLAGTLDYAASGTWRNRWAMKLFDYFTVLQNPNDDYLPNLDPLVHTPAPAPVANSDPAVVQDQNTPATLDKEANRPSEGLININTASEAVLAMLPLVPDGTAATAKVDVPNTVALAQAIVKWRRQNGPFHTIYDLNRVPGFQNAMGKLPIMGAGGAPQPQWGDLTPGSQPGLVIKDFKAQNLMVTRLSNLITTRSDCFTVYVLVQGYRNAGTPKPELVVQKRLAIIVDRSNVEGTFDSTLPVPTNTTPVTYSVPTD